MEAGLATHIWEIEEIIALLDAPKKRRPKFKTTHYRRREKSD